MITRHWLQVSNVSRRTIAVAATVILGGAAAAATTIPATAAQAATATGQYIYAAQDDGTIHVYDINANHRAVKTIRVFTGTHDVRGAAAAAPTHRLFLMYNTGAEGHVLALDLLTDKVLWDRVIHRPAVDRGSVTPDGKTLYVPTYEGSNVPYELVVDAMTGAIKTQVPLPGKSHDTIVSLDGTRVYMETKTADATLYVADTATNKVITKVGPYCCDATLSPFTVNGRGSRVFNCVYGLYGFQVADPRSGKVLQTVRITSKTTDSALMHGISLTPNETEIWLNDRGTTGSNGVFVFDLTKSPPVEKRRITLDNGVNPHWSTFDIAGRYAYVAGYKGKNRKTDVVSASTYQVVGHLSPSEDLFEVDFSNGVVTQVGNQFGVGRVR